MQFNFNFGNKKPDIKTYAIVGIVISSLIAFLSQCTGIPELKLWDLFDDAQRHLKPGTMVNDFIIKDPEKLQRRIHRDVDRAILDVTPEYDRILQRDNQRYAPRIKDLTNDDSVCYSKECKALAPPMEICSPWWDGCASSGVVPDHLTTE
jgi:hypothetical protein